MNIDEIRGLVKILEESQLSSLEISEGETKIRLEKQIANGTILSAPTLSKVYAEANNREPITVSVEESILPTANELIGTPIKCPMVGVFYAAPSPEDTSYVAVGDFVKKGEVVCIVEAMKLLNEIVAESDGKITEICVQNGEVVEFGQPLFYIK